jgi:hypothetical protein
MTLAARLDILKSVVVLRVLAGADMNDTSALTEE